MQKSTPATKPKARRKTKTLTLTRDVENLLERAAEPFMPYVSRWRGETEKDKRHIARNLANHFLQLACEALMKRPKYLAGFFDLKLVAVPPQDEAHSLTPGRN